MIHNRNSINERKYKTYRNKLNHIIGKAKRSYYKTKLQESQNKSKSVWTTLNDIIGKKKAKLKFKKIKDSNGAEITNSYEIGNTFNH